MASSSSFAQLDGIEFKVADVVKLKPHRFTPLNINLKDPTELLLNSEHDFSTEKKVLEWATVKHHRSSVKRPKKTVNAEMRLELETKLRSFVNNQKQNDAISLSNDVAENISKSEAETSLGDSTTSLNALFSPSNNPSTSPLSYSPQPTSTRSSPLENSVEEAPPPIPPRRAGASVSTPDPPPPVPLPRTYHPSFSSAQKTLPQINVMSPPVSTTNMQPYIQIQSNYRSYSSNNPFLNDLKDDVILQPQPANASSSESQNAGETDHAKIWADFENKDLDPFTNLELKSLDDMKELSRVLESSPQVPTNTPYSNGPTAAATPLTISYPNLNLSGMSQPPSNNPYNFVNLSGT